MKNSLWLFATLLLWCNFSLSQSATIFNADVMTIAEKTDYARTSTFQEVMDVVDALLSSSNLVHREELLTTLDGKHVPLLVLANPVVRTPQQASDSGKPVIYLQGNIHGGEVEGKEAIQILMRDILLGDKKHLLDNQIIVLVPIYNADGNDQFSENSRASQELSPILTGERHSHGYDLNRDGMAVEAPETLALFENIIQRWDPDLLVDLHTTNGTWHGYSLTYAPSYQTAGEAMTSDYTMDKMLPAITRTIKEKFNLDFGLYGAFDHRDWPPKELRTYHHAPRYLTNHMGLRNRMAILSETFAHDRFYKRVHAANVFIEEILEYTNSHGQEIRAINRQADQRVMEKIRSRGGKYKNGVAFEMIPLEQLSTIKTYSFTPYTTDDGAIAYARSSEIVEVEGVANYNRFISIKDATVPQAYVFSKELTSIAKKLEDHGIVVSELQNLQSFEGESFTVESLDSQNFVQNNHRNSVLKGRFEEATRQFEQGDFYVSMQTRLANLIFYLLEPQSDDGLVYWNYFDAYLGRQGIEFHSVDYPVFKVLK